MDSAQPVHIATPEGRQSVHSEEEARQLWATGGIAPGSHYWLPGMEQWRPAGEFFGAGFAAPPVTPLWAKDPTALTKAVVVLLWIILGLGLASALVSAVGLATGALPSPEEELTGYDVAQMGLGLLYTGVYLATAICFARWLYRANVNARALGAQGMTFTPGWTVGWFFVPVANLWKPFQAVRQIWQASRNPLNWVNEPAPALLNVWWTLWLAGNFLGQMSLRLSLRDSVDAQRAGEIVSVVSDVLDVPLCLVAIRLVKSIYDLQRAHAHA
jgi:hypothetical protein